MISPRLLLLLPAVAAAMVVPCDNDGDCYTTADWRCLPTTQAAGGRACTLDYAFNETGFCACSATGAEGVCVLGKYAAPTAGKKQYLVIGDSVSEGYFPTLKPLMAAAGYQAVHAPGNNDNVNWGSRCVKGWLGPDPARWTHITMNFGLHDLAFPDNEHLPVKVYSALLSNITKQIVQLAPKVKLAWVTTTPVPTDPPPQQGKPCTLIPGRLESQVLLYNKAAAAVVAQEASHHRRQHNVSVCDVHKVITDHCKVGYKACDWAQCGGPHFPGPGFAALGAAMAECVAEM